MASSRRRHPAAFKARVALEATKQTRTVAELAKAYQVHPTKNGKPAEQPIPPSLADALRPWLAVKPTGRPVFDPLPEKTGLMLKADLKRCGIEPVDDPGQVVDMHSLRHGYITTLAKAGIPVKTLQTLARHSDPKLILNVYSHLTLFDTASALDALPDLTRPNSSPEVVRMTGTDPAATPISNLLAHHLPTGGDASGRDVTHAGGMKQTTPDDGGCSNSLEISELDGPFRGLTGPVGSAPRRTRTYNPLIKSLPPSCPIPFPINVLGSSSVGGVANRVAPGPSVPVILADSRAGSGRARSGSASRAPYRSNADRWA